MTHATMRGTRLQSTNEHDRRSWNTGRHVDIDGQPESERPWLTCGLAEFWRWMDRWYPGWREEHNL